MHGTLSPELVAKLMPLRDSVDLYFDSGDCIKTGNLGVPLRPEPAWERLRDLRCTASVLGNRETHVLESAFKKKLTGASHPLLCANLRRKDGSPPLRAALELTVQGIRVGVVAVMVPMVTAKMRTQGASAYLWHQPISVAKRLAEELRPKTDLLIALTHIGFKQDLKLAEECPLFDAILGGHSHTILQEPIHIGKTSVCQAGSHNRFAGMYTWDRDAGFSGSLVSLR
jgi:2',3'-cyclic-nucleotide 2'-phosphodiesterase (5'-nucleotidase family)